MKTSKPTSNNAPNSRTLMALLILCLPVSFVLSVTLGTISIPLREVFAAFVSSEAQNTNQAVVHTIRIPRALLATMVGALLGICGATTQGLFRNPLADPSLIGITAGSSAGAALAIFGSSTLSLVSGLSGLWVVSFGAFLGGALSVTLVYKLATNQYGTSVATMLLAGIAITAIAGGITSLVEFFADNENLRRISLWRMGGLQGANMPRVWLALVVSIFTLTLLPRYATALNAFLLGESEARHLGIKVQNTKVQLILLVALAVGVSVALAGTIAFVGLVVPHIIRLLIGPNHHHLLWMSAVGGAVLLLIADTIARTVLAPIELPVGLVTALFGAPFFISLLKRKHELGLRT